MLSHAPSLTARPRDAERGATHDPKTPRTDAWSHASKQQLEQMPLADLLQRMRDGDPRAWTAFDSRYRPVLTQLARRLRLDEELRHLCVDDVLTNAAVRLTEADVKPPSNVTAYLLVAARNQLLNHRRATDRRMRRYAALTEGVGSAEFAEGVVLELCSEHLRRTTQQGVAPTEAQGPPPLAGVPRLDRRMEVPPARGPRCSGGTSDEETWGAPDGALNRLGGAVLHTMSEEEQLILSWVAAHTPHRQIASWLGASPDATAKRIWRLVRRLRGEAMRQLSTMSGDDYRSVERRLRAAGVSVPERLPGMVAGAAPLNAAR